MQDNYQTLRGQTTRYMAINKKTTINQKHTYTFLDYEVNPSSREIFQIKTQLKMTKKSFDILLLLIEKQGEVVTKEEMVERVWPSQIVTDAALNKQITRLRADLVSNRTTETPIIETVRGVGIRLVPPVNRIKTAKASKDNQFSKKWIFVFLAVTIALFSYTQYNKQDTSNKVARQVLSLNDTMVEIRSAMSINKKAFISQIKRRNELGEILNKRFEIEKSLSWERRFLKFHNKMNQEELFIFSQIKAYTDGPLLSSNQEILELINSKKEIIDEIPSADKLRNHLIIWLNKYDKVFKNNEKMSLLYVGVEDGAPYPSEVDQQVVDWLEKNNQPTQEKQPQSLNIAIVPSLKTEDWLNVGGLKHLSSLLQKHQEIQSISPKSKWYKSEDKQNLAIEISQRDGVDYVLGVNNLQKGKEYITNLVLRNKDKVIVKETIKTESLVNLFEKIDLWLTRQLKITSKIAKGEIGGYKVSDFVLESYLRGRDFALYKSYKKAAQLFQTAINQDPKFFIGWAALADVESELGNYQKSLAMIESIINLDDFDKSLLNHLYTVQAKNLMFLNKYDESLEALDKSMQISRQQQNYGALVRAMTVQVVIHGNTNNMTQETIDILLKQLKILKEHKPDPDLIALTNANLAGACQNMGKLTLALKHAKLAAEMYNIANDLHGTIFSHILLARINHSTGDIEKALMTLAKVDEKRKQLDGLQVNRMFLQYKAENQTYLGLRKQALLTIDELMELSLNYSDLTSKVIALILLVDLNIVFKDYKAAKIVANQLLEIDKTKPSGYILVYQDIVYAYDLFISSLLDSPVETRQKLKTYLKPGSSLATDYQKELKKIDANLLIKEGFKLDAIKIYHQLIKEYSLVNQTMTTLQTGYDLLDVLWQYDMKDYVKTMNYLDEIAVFKYPIHKYKAQYIAYNKDYISAHAMMVDLKSKANEFWTTSDQIVLESYQELSNN